MQLSGKRVVEVVGEGFQDQEATVPLDLSRRREVVDIYLIRVGGVLRISHLP